MNISEQLKDIRDVSVDKNLSKDGRLIEFVRQIGDPYNFKCGEFTITANFPPNAPSMESCLKGIMI